VRLTPDGLESTKRTGGGIRCVDNYYRDWRGPSRKTPSGSWNLSRKTLDISQLGPFPRRLSVLRSIDSIHDSRRARALINLTFRFLFSSQTTCYTLHQFVPSPTIGVLGVQRRRSNRYRFGRHRSAPRRVPPGGGRVLPTTHFLSRLRRHVLRRYLTRRDQDHPTRSLFWDPASSGSNLAPAMDLVWNGAG